MSGYDTEAGAILFLVQPSTITVLNRRGRMNNCCRRIAAQARDEVAKALNGENPPGAVEYVFDQFSLRVALLTYAKRQAEKGEKD